MKPKKLERYYDDDDMYYIDGMTTRPEKPGISKGLQKLIGALLLGTITFMSLALWFRLR